MKKITVYKKRKRFTHSMLNYGITDSGSLHVWDGEEYYVYSRDQWDGYKIIDN